MGMCKQLLFLCMGASVSWASRVSCSSSWDGALCEWWIPYLLCSTKRMEASLGKLRRIPFFILDMKWEKDLPLGQKRWT